MRIETISLTGTTPGVTYALDVLHFGVEGARPKATIQAGLHADEAPGMLCALHLRRMLEKLEAESRINGHIVLIPAANPVGMAQFQMGTHHGRFALADGTNFNRDFPDLAESASALIAAQLGDDPEWNSTCLQAALLLALENHRPLRPADHLKKQLLLQAVNADTVLDLHCDGEAAVHLYVQTSHAAAFRPLAAWLEARAMLTCEESGGHPFDEAITGPWVSVRKKHPQHPFPEGPIAATVELRGEADVSDELAAQDGRAVRNFLAHRGHLSILPDPLPELQCEPTPLAGSEALEAPLAGLIVYRHNIGDQIKTGDIVAEIVDPASGEATTVAARTSGVLFARAATRFASAGKRLGKIAGKTPFRTGPLLSP
ncbi:MAG: succinylglutamate desuccinylase/aspartoacylase family protein [Beijerinckiaceae bacterium]